MRGRRLLFISAILLLVVSVIACFKPDAGDFALSKEAVVMRNIGHQILLSTGDSTSRVLPVGRVSDREYLIRFEHAFTFKTDSIMKIVRQVITAGHLPPDYVVDVTDSRSKQIVYGFAVLKTEQNHILPCRGRIQPKANYAVHIKFRDTNTGLVNKNNMVRVSGSLAVIMLIFSGLGMNRRQDKTYISPIPPTSTAATSVIAIGLYRFNPANPYLELNEEQIKLSDKEFKLLTILTRHKNTVVDRHDLQKVWEDDGVIVGRSLDMFISKLRKKLDQDPAVKLVNVHGKGYKLEVI